MDGPGWGFGHDSRETHARFAREKRNSPSHAAMPERELPGGYTKKNKEKASHVMEKGNNLVMDSCIGSTESTKKMRGIA